MLLCGLWHGAGYTYVVWGLLHGVFLAVERLVVYGDRPIPRRQRIRSATGFVKAVFATGAVFALISLAWVVFRAPSLADAGMYLARMFTAGGWVVQAKLLVQLGVAFVGLLIVEVTCYTRQDEWFFRGAGRWRGLAYAGAAVYLVIFGGASGNVPFIYFQF